MSIAAPREPAAHCTIYWRGWEKARILWALGGYAGYAKRPSMNLRKRQRTAEMAKDQEPTTIKKYANRRLYNTGTSTYVTLEDLAEMVKSGEDFTVVDAKSGEEITRSVLTQIIFEQENKGQNLLPITFLRQLIRFYGDSIQNLIPTYLDFSIDSLVRDQDKLRGQMTNAFGPGAFGPATFVPGAMDVIGDQVRRNTEMFEQAMRMFLPFGNNGAATAPAREPKSAPAKPPEGGDIDALKRQLDEMQSRLDKLSDKK
jgi:polyhydroxyalkanoate synthesis repressor PhaR